MPGNVSPGRRSFPDEGFNRSRLLQNPSGADQRHDPTMNLGPHPLAERQVRLNRETLDHWSLYRSHREAVAHLVGQAPQPASARLCVLGAGNCNDLDSARFTRRFAQIHLVDLDRQAVVKGVQWQRPPNPERIQIHGGVDLTGVLKTLATWQRNQPRRESIDHCIREALAFVGLPFLGQFEVVVSTCMLTQLIDSVVSMTGSSSIPLELVRALRLRHLRLLAELLLPDGVGILVTDFALSYDSTREALPRKRGRAAFPGSSFLGVNPEELFALVRKDAFLRSRVHQTRLSPPWLWQQNPRRTLLVRAIRFQRIQAQPGLLDR